MIVDDEHITRQGLESLIPWEQYGFTVIDTATNGKEAYEKYAISKIDLMIVDIQMPVMTGLELIERIRSIDSDSSVHFLILSGYADFDYAKKAITHRVEGYLLKPVDEDELIEFLGEIKVKLERESVYEKLKLIDEENTKEHIIKTALSGEKTEEITQLLQNHLVGKRYQIILIKLSTNEDNDSTIITRIKHKFVTMFEGNDRGLVFENKPIIGVILGDAGDDGKARKELYEELKRAIREFDFEFTAAVGIAVNHVDELKQSYDSAMELLEKSFFYEGEQILIEDSKRFPYQNNLANNEQGTLKSNLEKLFYALEIGNKESVEKICLNMGILMVNEGYTEDSIKSNFVQAVSTVLNKLSYEYPELDTLISEYSSRFVDIYKQSTFKSLLMFVTTSLENLIDHLNIDNSDILVKKMIDLIERNYHKNIKLDTLAEILNYNSAYIGKVFKKSTGDYFNTYLDKKRIENAKKLLLQGLKVYQVAERVGYSNVDYFHSKFKKYEGMSPSSYRKDQSLNK